MSNLTLSPPITAGKAKKEFINYIHSFRGLAIIFVVSGHLLLKWEDDSITYKAIRVLCENGTVLFVFIAGFLFQFLSRKFEFKTYLSKKVANVVVPYILVSLPIIVYRLTSNDIPGYIINSFPDFTNWTGFQKLLYFLFTGAHMQQLWFVPMIAIFYLTAPIFIALDRNSKWYYVLIPLVVLSSILIREPFNDIPRMFIHFLSVYIFGMFVSRYRQRFLGFMDRYRVLLSLVTILLLAFNYYYFPLYNNAFNYLHKMMFCAVFIYLLWKYDRFVPSLLGSLAEISFGIFFVHYYVLLVIKAIYEKFMHQPIPGNLIYWIIDFLLVMILTVVSINIVKKIFPNNSRTLVGC